MSGPNATTRFAQFLGLGKKPSQSAAKSSNRADDDKKPDPDAKDDEQDPKSSVVGEDDDKKPDQDGRRAEDGDDDRADDDKKPDPDAEDDGDDAGAEDDGDDEKDAKSKKAAKAERARAGRIIAHGIDSGSVEAAAVLAFTTGMSSASAIRVLDQQAAANKRAARQSNSLRNRMDQTNLPSPGAGGGGQTTVAQRILQAGKVRRGEKQ